MLYYPKDEIMKKRIDISRYKKKFVHIEEKINLKNHIARKMLYYPKDEIMKKRIDRSRYKKKFVHIEEKINF